MIDISADGISVGFFVINVGFNVKKLIIFGSSLLCLINLLLLAFELVEIIVILVYLAQSSVLRNVFPQAH